MIWQQRCYNSPQENALGARPLSARCILAGPVEKELKMFNLLIVEDNEKLRPALRVGMENTGEVQVVGDCASGETALAFCLAQPPTTAPQALLMDVHLAGEMNGIEATLAIRREFPRLPVVFYSIQDDDSYYRDFRQSGILSHYAYVRKSNYLLPQMLLPLLRDAINGRSFIDPDIEARVQEVRHKDEYAPFSLLEPNEQEVARMLALGMSNEQIAQRMGFRDKRTISRINGQIYTAWDLKHSATDEKVARTRAAIIVRTGRLLSWDESGQPRALDDRGEWVAWPNETQPRI
jgi:DNA-binding NarL/FixJ family response regulator